MGGLPKTLAARRRFRLRWSRPRSRWWCRASLFLFSCARTGAWRFVMMWISFLINLFVVVKGRRFVLFSSIKGAQILAADFYLEKMSSFVPRRIETPVTKNEESEERRGNFEKKWNQKESTCVSQKVHLFQSRRQENKHHYDFRTQYFGREKK